MSLRDKLLKKAIRYLQEVHGCQEFQVALDQPSTKHKYPFPPPFGEKGVKPDLVCIHPETQRRWLLIVVEDQQKLQDPKYREVWRNLWEEIECRKDSHRLIFLTYRRFGHEDGAQLLRNQLLSLFWAQAKEVQIWTYHRGRIGPA